MRDKPNATVLLKEPSHKVTPSDILLYPQIGVFLAIITETSILQYMGTNTETHDWTTCRVRDLGTPSPMECLQLTPGNLAEEKVERV